MECLRGIAGNGGAFAKLGNLELVQPSRNAY